MHLVCLINYYTLQEQVQYDKMPKATAIASYWPISGFIYLSNTSV